MATITFTDLEINLDFALSYDYPPKIMSYVVAIDGEDLYNQFITVNLRKRNDVYFNVEAPHKRGTTDVHEYPHAPQSVHNLFVAITH